MLFLVLLFSFGFVNASTTFKVDCPTKGTALGVIKCTVSIKPDNYGLDGLSFNYDITGGTYESFTPNASNYSKLSITQYGAMLNRETTYTGSGFDTVGTLAVKMPSSGSISIVFNNISIITYRPIKSRLRRGRIISDDEKEITEFFQNKPRKSLTSRVLYYRIIVLSR